MVDEADTVYMTLALEHAVKGAQQGGIPCGGVLVRDGKVVSMGFNRRIQENNPAAHAALDCLRLAGAQMSFDGAALYLTSSPCAMCAGAVIRYGLSRVVVGDSFNYAGELGLLRERGVEVLEMNAPDCVRILETLFRERAGLWDGPLPPHVGKP